ncbi:MAG: hypothetical protein AAF352_06925, partial [Pseudomonadota bacterium]
VATCNGRNWYNGDTKADVNGQHSSQFWKLVNQTGNGQDFTPGCDRGGKFTALDYFLAVFPMKQLKLMTDLTSKQLGLNGKDKTTIGKMLQWFGIIILATRFEFGTRASLWPTKSHTRLAHGTL